MQKSLVGFTEDVTLVLWLYNINVWNYYPEGHNILSLKYSHEKKRSDPFKNSGKPWYHKAWVSPNLFTGPWRKQADSHSELPLSILRKKGLEWKRTQIKAENCQLRPGHPLLYLWNFYLGYNIWTEWKESASWDRLGWMCPKGRQRAEPSQAKFTNTGNFWDISLPVGQCISHLSMFKNHQGCKFLSLKRHSDLWTLVKHLRVRSFSKHSRRF